MKIILADKTEYPILDGATLSIITAVLDNYSAMDTLETALRAPGNLKTVIFAEDSQSTGDTYTEMKLLDPTYTMAKKTEDGKVLATFGIREMTDQEKEIESLKKYQWEEVGIALSCLSDEEALTVKKLHPEWRSLIGRTVKIGTRFLYEDNLFRTLQDNLLIQEQWVPGVGTESIYVRIDESHAGTMEDPIPYDGNMVLENGKYYIQDGIIYLCNRNTEIAVYQPLSELVGIYVEVAL